MKNYIFIIVLSLFCLSILQSQESPQYNADLDYAQVIFVKAVRATNQKWSFYVTVRHNDQGWNHYANVWEIIDPQTQEVLGTRVLAHPHDTEQPFTRSLSNVIIPEHIQVVIIRARCNLHDFEGKQVVLDFSISKTAEYEIEY